MVDSRTVRSGLPRDDSGKLVHFTFPGGYEIAYYFADGERACYACACEFDVRNKVEEADPDDFTTPGETIAMHDIYWAGPVEICAHCNAECASEYGDPNADESTEV